LSQRREKADQAVRRSTFFAAVGGRELLADSLMTRLNDEFSELHMSTNLAARTAQAIADQLAKWWGEGGDTTDGRTPQQFVDEQFRAFVDVSKTDPVRGLTRWALRRQALPPLTD
jgi:hypothetical protein